MKLAAIDMGTNSSRLLMVSCSKGKIRVLKRKLITTRLGEGVDQFGMLKQKAIKRAIKAVKQFKSEIKKIGDIQKIEMVGTSALRDVGNAVELVELIEKETGYNLEIIDGQEEAYLTYCGVRLDCCEQKPLVIDIGGGSTEFIWEEDDKTYFKSLNIGAVRMTERFISDPESPFLTSEYENLASEIYKLLDRELSTSFNDRLVIGVGGTITTLAAMDLKLEQYNRNKIHGHILKTKQIKNLLHKIGRLKLKERKEVRGLQPERADIIIVGTVILEMIVKYMNLDKIAVSEFDLLFGLIYRNINYVDNLKISF